MATRLNRPLLAATAWAFLILVLCLMPGRALPTWQWADLFSLDKLVHFSLFLVLAVLLAQGLTLRAASRTVLIGPVILAFLLAVAYGALTELMQQLPSLGRRGDLNDLLANALGAAVGAVYFHRKLGKAQRTDR
ncbi:MAG: VanZ family protein [Flavobacteriales bacterium]|nr:VanZ family protein [Flavobacteriales bacterium]